MTIIDGGRFIKEISKIKYIVYIISTKCTAEAEIKFSVDWGKPVF